MTTKDDIDDKGDKKQTQECYFVSYDILHYMCRLTNLNIKLQKTIMLFLGKWNGIFQF